MNEPARSIISKVSPTRHLVPARRIVSTHFRSRPTPNCTVLHGCVQVNQHAKRRKLMPQVPAQGLPREPCLSQEKRRKRRPLQPSLHFERRPSCQTQAEVRRIPTTTDVLCMTCPHRRAQEGGGGSSLFQPDPIETDCNRIDFRSAVLQFSRDLRYFWRWWQGRQAVRHGVYTAGECEMTQRRAQQFGAAGP